ncbi:MAG: HK97 gp10 family phage protein [Acidobacteria bacterium]|nr:HK97 gp10 family phage protein [Acidobacteriota bacterium]
MKWNEDWFSKFGHSSEVTAVIRAKAEQAASLAKSSAQVDTGAYRDSIHVEVKSAKTRNVALVVASSPHSVFVESRTGNLARALGQVAGHG